MIFMEILTEEESNMWELNLLVLKFVFHGVADPGEDIRFPVMDFFQLEVLLIFLCIEIL